jgi:hypothetical protein
MSTARAPWHRLAGPAEAVEPVEIPPRPAPAGCDQQGRRLTRHDSAEVAAAALKQYREASDAEARALEEAVEYPHEGSHRSASKVVAALFLAYLGGWATHAAMPWLAPALLRAMGIV